MSKNIIKKALVVLNGSEASIYGAKYAIILAKSYNIELYVLYVIDTMVLKELLKFKIFIEDESIEAERSLEKNGEMYLNYIEEIAKSKGIKIKKIVKKGEAVNTILETAEEIHADVIMIGCWEPDRPKRDLVNKFHFDLVSYSKIPVILIKEENVDDLLKKT
jgi:nucleotide-binding universal stress UspA family protein